MTNQSELILALAKQAQDTSKPLETRREALRHLALLRSEPTTGIDAIHIDDLSEVGNLVTVWKRVHPSLSDLTIATAMEWAAEWRARREFEARRQ